MDRLTELNGHSDQLAQAIRSLVDSRRGADSSDQLGPSADTDVDRDQSLFTRAKSNILASIAAIKSIVGEPADFLQDFSRQVSGTSHHLLPCPFYFSHLNLHNPDRNPCLSSVASGIPSFCVHPV